MNWLPLASVDLPRDFNLLKNPEAKGCSANVPPADFGFEVVRGIGPAFADLEGDVAIPLMFHQNQHNSNLSQFPAKGNAQAQGGQVYIRFSC